jgi:SAM-dependent methyltransferase
MGEVAREIRRHYEVERELADRLRASSRDERLQAYGALYDELFRRVPWHPQLARKGDSVGTERGVSAQLALLERWLEPSSTFLEIGAGDLALTRRVAERVARVYAVEVSAEIVRGADAPSNVQVVLSDGVGVPVPPASVHIAYSNQVMEHLHPDDAVEQLANIATALVPGGRYIVMTPHRLSGPHDVSKHFDETATGFHLREYTARELRPMLRAAGFRRVSVIAGGKGRFVTIPLAPVAAVERLLEPLPRRWRRRLVLSPLLRPALLLCLVAVKDSFR